MQNQTYHVERQRQIVEIFEVAAASGEEACHLVNTDQVKPMDVDVLQQHIANVEAKELAAA